MIPDQSVAKASKMCSFPVEQSVKEDSNNFLQYMAALERIIQNYNQQLLYINQKYNDVKFESSLRLSSISQLILIPFDNFRNRLTIATSRYKELMEDLGTYLKSFEKSEINPAFQQDYEKDFQEQEERIHIDLQTQFLSCIRQLAYATTKYCDFVASNVGFLRQPTAALIGEGQTDSVSSNSATGTSVMLTSQSSQEIESQFEPQQSYVLYVPEAAAPGPELSYIPPVLPVEQFINDAPVI